MINEEIKPVLMKPSADCTIVGWVEEDEIRLIEFKDANCARAFYRGFLSAQTLIYEHEVIE